MQIGFEINQENKKLTLYFHEEDMERLTKKYVINKKIPARQVSLALARFIETAFRKACEVAGIDYEKIASEYEMNCKTVVN